MSTNTAVTIWARGGQSCNFEQNRGQIDSDEFILFARGPELRVILGKK
jgi:hypothetical protein